MNSLLSLPQIENFLEELIARKIILTAGALQQLLLATLN